MVMIKMRLMVWVAKLDIETDLPPLVNNRND